MNDRQKAVAELCDGIKTSKQIALLLNDNPKYVQKTMLQFDLPRLKIGAQKGEKNPSYKYGRIIDKDGYVTVPTPVGHKGHLNGRMFEHRLVMEKHLNRCLNCSEVVDHIDGLHLHNDPSNLRVFANNSEHLKETISGQRPKWSYQGYQNMCKPRHQLLDHKRIHTYRLMKKCGDVRLKQILLAWLLLDKDNQHLLGTSHHLTNIGIDPYCDYSLKRALDDLSHKYA